MRRKKGEGYLNLIRSYRGQLIQNIKNSDFTYSEDLLGKNIKYRKTIIKDSPGKNHLYDIVLLNTEYQIYELGAGASHNNLVFLCHHPLALVHTWCGEWLGEQIRNFKGKTIAISGFSRDYLKQHYHKDAQVLPDPLNPVFWPPDFRRTERERDILFNYVPGRNKGDDLCEKFAQQVLIRRPYSKIGFFMSIVDSTCSLKKRFPDAAFYFDIPNQRLQQMYKNYKVFVFPSRFEGFGIPPLEAISSGTIPAVMDVGAISSYAQDNINAIFMKEDDIDKAIDKCLAVLENRALYEQYQAGCDINYEPFNPYTYANRLLDAIAFSGRRDT